MGRLDASQCNSRTPEGLEASHRGASAFDRAMILLNKIVEVLATPHLNVLPLRILPPQKPFVATSIVHTISVSAVAERRGSDVLTVDLQYPTFALGSRSPHLDYVETVTLRR
jgi:hypothetical protein